MQRDHTPWLNPRALDSANRSTLGGYYDPISKAHLLLAALVGTLSPTIQSLLRYQLLRWQTIRDFSVRLKSTVGHPTIADHLPPTGRGTSLAALGM